MLLPVLLASLTPQDQAPPARGLEVFPLQSLCAPAPPLQPPRFGTLLAAMDQQFDLLHTGEGGRQFAPEQAQELVRTFHDPDLASGALAVEVQGGAMLVWAEPALLAQVRAELKDVQAILARPIAIDAQLYAWEADEPPPALLGPKELAQFRQGRTPLWSGTTTTRSNRAARLGAERTTRYVFGVDIEIAQKSMAAVPRIESFFEGLALTVLPHALCGSQDVVLHAQLALGRRRGETKSQRTGLPDQAAMDAPLLESTSGGFSGRVPNGGALVVACAGHAAGGGRFVLAVSPRFETPVANPVVAGLGIYPISALTATALDTRYVPPRRGNWYEMLADADGSERFGRFDEDFLVQMLRDTLRPVDDSARWSVRAAGGHLFVKGAPEQLASIETTLRALQDRVLQTVEVRAAVRLQEADGTGVLAAPRGDAGAVLHVGVLPTLLGREATLLRSLETPILAKYEARIAAEAQALDPQTERNASGLWVSAAVVPAPEGLNGDLRLQLEHAPDAPTRAVEPGAIHAFPEVAAASFARSGDCPSGRTVDLGAGPAVPVDGRTWRTALQVTLTRL